tara:strand:+ start:110 stop:550 length:441 start_codon:yes stop_codon:yes gene_type:complete
MGATSFLRPAVEEEVDGKVVTKRISLKRDLSGKMIKFVEFVEDEENSSVSSRTINSDAFVQAVVNSAEISSSLTVEDLASQISEDYMGPYVLNSVPKANTLSVYLNGQLVNDHILISNDKEITFTEELDGAVVEDSSVYAIYVEEF